MHISGPETGIGPFTIGLAQKEPVLRSMWRKNRKRGGQVLRCETCERHIFPRTDPVVIMLIIDASMKKGACWDRAKEECYRATSTRRLRGLSIKGSQ